MRQKKRPKRIERTKTLVKVRADVINIRALERIPIIALKNLLESIPVSRARKSQSEAEILLFQVLQALHRSRARAVGAWGEVASKLIMLFIGRMDSDDVIVFKIPYPGRKALSREEKIWPLYRW